MNARRHTPAWGISWGIAYGRMREEREQVGRTMGDREQMKHISAL
jgi:hypothetical protein